jgi:acyl dehydratase
MLLRAPAIGDTLRTATEIVALKRNSAKPGRAPTGLAVLRVRTVDQERRPVLDFWRCAMLPLRDADAPARSNDDLDAFGAGLPAEGLAASVEGWDLAAFRDGAAGEHFADLRAPAAWVVEGGDTVTCAPELARLSLNVAMTHTDPGAGRDGRRLVYGGHTIGIAAAHLTRALPNLVTLLGWHECNHLGPVMEGDVLHTVVTLERTEPLPAGGGLAHLRCEVTAHRADGDGRDAVLDWRLVGALA